MVLVGTSEDDLTRVKFNVGMKAESTMRTMDAQTVYDLRSGCHGAQAESWQSMNFM